MTTPTTPVVTSPHGGLDFTTNRTLVTFGGTVDLTGVSDVLVNGSLSGVSYTPGSGVWVADVTLQPGVNSFEFQALSDDVTPVPSLTTTVEVTYSDEVGFIVTNPTGIEEDVLKEAVKVSWVENPEAQVVGYNVYGSLSPGGGDTGYQKINSLLISTVAEIRTSEVPVSEEVSQVGATRTTTTVVDIVSTNIYALTINQFDGDPLSLGQTIHFVVTAVAFDGTSSAEVESSYSEEIAITPLILTQARVQAPTRTQKQIATDYASLIRDAHPNLDIKPGTITNDVHIQPPATEMEKLYFLLDFLSKAQSFAELVAIDDPDGDGVSDLVTDVPYKRALKEALSTGNDVTTQEYIDSAFTRLAINSGTARGTSQYASGPYLFYTSTAPTTDVTIPAGTTVSSQGNSQQGVTAQEYATAASVTVPIALISAYYNTSAGRYEFPAFIKASSPGAAGNQDVGDIGIVVSGPNITLQGENPEVLDNGADEESNSHLAVRAILAFLGVDSGTVGGYLKTAISIPTVERASVVGAGDPDMQRDFDTFLRDHRDGKVDIYIKGTTLIDVQDTSAFSYYQETANSLTVLDATNFIFEVDTATAQLSASSSYPLFEVTSVYNVTQDLYYDVNRARFDGDQFTLDNTLPGNTGLLITDVVQADFRWRDGAPIILSTQPVESVTTVVGSSSGSLVAGVNYNFDKSSDPMVLGNSYRSIDAVLMNFGGGAQVTDESHTLTALVVSQLENPDVDTSTIVVTDSTGEVTYSEGSDYELDTFQCVEFVGEEHQLSSLSAAPLDFDTVDASTIDVYAGLTPSLMTEGVDYTVSTSGLVTSLTRIFGGGISEGETVYVTYRITVPVLFTTLARVGGSTISSGQIVLVDYQLGVPRGRPELVEGESLVLVGTEFFDLSQKGALSGFFTVTNDLETITYTEGVDYLIDLGTDDTATQIRRLDGGSIVDGSTVLVTYRVNEQFVITYAYNDLLRVVQDEVEVTRHATADVLVKSALITDVDLEITVVPLRGVNRVNLINNIRTAISRYFNSLDLGAGVFQADIIKVIEDVTGVDHTVVPFLKMARAEGSLVLREEHRNPIWLPFTSVPPVPVPGNVADTFKSAVGTLVSATTSGGGSQYRPHGVYEDEVPMYMVNDAASVKAAFGRAYISSDGSVVISPVDGLPYTHTYAVTYQVGVETGVRDIRLTSLEYAGFGEISISLSDPEL